MVLYIVALRRRSSRMPGGLRAKGTGLGGIAAAVGVSKESIRRWVATVRSRRRPSVGLP